MNFAPLRRILSLAAAVSCMAVAVQAQELSSALTFKVVTVAADGSETLVERETVRPGDVIEYQIAHQNGTEQDISGLAIALPVPNGVTVTLGAERSSLPADFQVQAELEPEKPGLEWSALPAFRTVIEPDGSIRREALPADAIAAVRWTLDAVLPSGETAVNAYRVTVN